LQEKIHLNLANVHFIDVNFNINLTMQLRMYHSTTQNNLPCLKGLKASKKIYLKPLSIYVERVDKKLKESIEKNVLV